MLKENDVFDKLNEKDSDIVAMALYLQEQSGDPESKWKEYLDILPSDVSNFPIFALNMVQKLTFFGQKVVFCQSVL